MRPVRPVRPAEGLRGAGGMEQYRRVHAYASLTSDLASGSMACGAAAETVAKTSLLQNHAAQMRARRRAPRKKLNLGTVFKTRKFRCLTLEMHSEFFLDRLKISDELFFYMDPALKRTAKLYNK